ncbi:sugar transferase [Hydrogenothermus marinus]|uniref:Lipopolysaccharide/colanic/teichoic acid biosynthesis glycosyltransferase n=1 Tax=Hydrogenothermus marinus TaxID=133270 RepID=A0A3M0BE94_9AQUI|nr:sugar transferase [Hydrogenothermus marinus]RMA93308.1 lipopolysaccharide/colanic/teichoic acid biosynthesis glycosyltransferase [Hydrogenothermus marinus]
MIVIGDSYKFTKYDLEKLNKKFPQIVHISYKDKNVKDVIKAIKQTLDNEKGKKLIVLNTDVPVPDELIKYLTSLELEGISFLSIEHFLEKYLHKCYIPENPNDLSFLEDIKPYSKWQYIQKRFIDFFGIFWLFFFSWPVMLYCVYRIKKESPEGPIFFKQKRVGKNGKEFVCIKFRSMVPDAEKGKPQFANEDDPRVFKWGVVMRKTRLDELPQMWNILKGEMHLIGPRPERKYWVEQFEKVIPYYNERHVVAPGITGWAQVNYPYGANVEDAKQKLMYDLYYIKNWNIWLELKIVWKTAMTVIMKKGV